MENTRVLGCWTGAPPHFWKRAFAVWAAVAAACGLYGFFGPGRSSQPYGEPFNYHIALQVAACFLALGAGVGTSAAAGVSLLFTVRARRIRKVWAVTWLALSGIVGAMLTPVIMVGARAIKAWNILHEEEAALTIAGVSWWTIEATAACCVVFSILIILTGRDAALGDGPAPSNPL